MQRLMIAIGLGTLAGIASLAGNGALTILGLVPLAFFVGAFAIARSERGTMVDIARAVGIGLLGLAAATVWIFIGHLLIESIPTLLSLRGSLRAIKVLWVTGVFVLGCWLLVGIIIREHQ